MSALARIERGGHPWSLKPHRLRFVLGDRLLTTIATPAAFLEAPVEMLGDDPAALIATLAAMPAPVAALVIPSHPLPTSDWQPPRGAGVLVRMPSRHAHSMIELHMGAEAYRAAMPKKRRHEIERKHRRFAQTVGHPAEVRLFRTPDEVARFLDHVAPLARATYQTRLLKVGLPLDPAFRARTLAQAAADDIRAFALDIEGRAAAFGFCDAQGARLSYQFTGYDPQHRALSLGVLLLDRMLDQLFAEGRFTAMDLGHGDAQYKREFATRSVDCATLLVYRATPRNRALLAAHGGVDRLNASAIEAIEQAGLKQRLKRWMRG